MSPSPAHDAFLVMAATWFNCELTDVIRMLAMKDKPCGSLIYNMQQVFVAGYELGRQKQRGES